MSNRRIRSSVMPGFHKLPFSARRITLATALGLEPDALAGLIGAQLLSEDTADAMIENAVGMFNLPLGLGLNMQVNGKDYVIPMAVEEPSVIAAVSSAAKIIRKAGGFQATAMEPMMIGQIQLTGYGDPERAAQLIRGAADELVALANRFHPQLVLRGGGARELEVRILPPPEGAPAEPLVIIHLHIDTREAMGANLINTMVEGIAPRIEQLTQGKVYLRILSNLADRRLTRAWCVLPIDQLGDFGVEGAQIAEGIVQATRFAQADPYRAATHNKGVMNGIDPVAIATGQDWRAIEAGAHAYAARSGRYRPLSSWRREAGFLEGTIELPLALGTVGGALKVHPGVQAALQVIGTTSAQELSMVIAAVGLAQNFAALRALGSVGIQRGHMALHARSVAVTAGAPRELIEVVAAELVRSGEVKVEKARDILSALAGTGLAAEA